MTAGVVRQRVVWASPLLLLVGLLPGRVHAWSEAGHRVVALIAEAHLKDAAKAHAADLMGGSGLEAVATRADFFRDAHDGQDTIEIERATIHGADTRAWHFVNIPVHQGNRPSRYHRSRHCAQDNCVVEQLVRFTDILSEPGRRRDERAAALKFIVHLMADLHQPLHCAEKGRDRGGNNVPVIFFGQDSTLHAVWDDGLIARTGVEPRPYARKLAMDLTPQRIARLQRGNVVAWAEEAHRAAARNAYVLPTPLNLDEAYYRRNLPVVNDMLAKAGLRLAHVFNGAFKN